MLSSTAIRLIDVATGGYVLGQSRDELVVCDGSKVQSTQSAYGYGAVLLLLVADDKNVRHLLQAVLPNFTSDFFTAQIGLYSKALFFQALRDFSRIIG